MFRRRRALAALVMLVVGLLFVSHRVGRLVVLYGLRKASPGAVEADLPGEVEVSSGAMASPAKRTVKLFFEDAQSGAWAVEERTVVQTASEASQAKQALAELFLGPRRKGHAPSCPPGARLEELILSPDGTAYVDLSSDFVPRGRLGGSEVEHHAVFAVVHTLTVNFPEIRRVRFLIQGQPMEHLGGHLYMGSAFRSAESEEDIPPHPGGIGGEAGLPAEAEPPASDAKNS
ncbi:MAG: GerMN domain-containing protein [Acidobacteriota bacterium]|nr:MAG: GerMN domain-containing protein [Acidobacteriota bacterium]